MLTAEEIITDMKLAPDTDAPALISHLYKRMTEAEKSRDKSNQRLAAMESAAAPVVPAVPAPAKK